MGPLISIGGALNAINDILTSMSTRVVIEWTRNVDPWCLIIFAVQSVDPNNKGPTKKHSVLWCLFAVGEGYVWEGRVAVSMKMRRDGRAGD